MTKPFNLSRIKIVKVKTKDSFQGRYKGHEISIEREEDPNMGFYIQVTDPRGMYAYDGYFGDGFTTIEEAMTDAVKGSLLA